MKRILNNIIILLILTSTVSYGSEKVSLLTTQLVEDGFNQPMGMCQDSKGHVYVVDSKNNTIDVDDGNGFEIFAGNKDKKDIYGFPLGGLKDGQSLDALFNGPRDIICSDEDILYVVDTENHVIRKISDGVVSTLAGIGTSGNKDGSNQYAAFNKPSGIAISSTGHIYVADTLNNSIRVIDEYGVVTTMELESKNVDEDTHILNEPSDVYFDENNTMYILDSGNQQVKKNCGWLC